MNSKVWLIRGQDSFGWSDYPAIYGDTITSKETALSLAKKLEDEGHKLIAVYECQVIAWFGPKGGDCG